MSEPDNTQTPVLSGNSVFPMVEEDKGTAALLSDKEYTSISPTM